MDTQYLHEFIVLAELCNFQEAAERLHVSQSALSKHIQKLERELDEPLFERSARAVTLSKYGAAFLDYARQITALGEEARRHLHKIRTADSQRLVVACPPALERYGLVELLAEFRRLYPDTRVESISSIDPISALRAGRCGFAFVQADLRDAPDIGSVLYQKDYPVAVLPPKHPLASEQTLTMEQLKHERFILYNRAQESTTVPQSTLIKLCAAAGFEPNIAMSASFSSTIVSLVSQGLGISVMQRLQVPENAGQVALVRIETTLSTDIQLIYRKSEHPAPVWVAFAKYVHQHALTNA